MLSNVPGTKFDIARAWRHSSAARLFGCVQRALQGALPQACVLCAAASGNAMICNACAACMPTIRDACPRCALASPGNAICGACLSKPLPLDATIAAWCYAFPADCLLHAFKYGGRLALAEPLADAVANAVRARRAPLPDCLVAMPLAPRRQRERGFNHAHEIARRVSSHFAIPLAHALRRTRDAPPQAGLTLRERARNVRDAFEAREGAAGRSVAIVDDVMTTGATLGAAARALRKVGAVRVDAWIVARTPPATDRGSGIGIGHRGILADTDP
jgi:ComF family protein